MRHQYLGSTITNKTTETPKLEIPTIKDVTHTTNNYKKINVVPFSNLMSSFDPFLKRLKNLQNSFSVNFSRFMRKSLPEQIKNIKLGEYSEEEGYISLEKIVDRYSFDVDVVLMIIEKYLELMKNVNAFLYKRAEHIKKRLQELKERLKTDAVFLYNVSLEDVLLISNLLKKPSSESSFIIFKGNYIDEVTSVLISRLINCGLLIIDIYGNDKDISEIQRNKLYLFTCNKNKFELYREYFSVILMLSLIIETFFKRFFFDRIALVNTYYQDIIETKLFHKLINFTEENVGIIIASIILNTKGHEQVRKFENFLSKAAARNILNYSSSELMFFDIKPIKKIYLIDTKADDLTTIKAACEEVIFYL